MTVFRQTMILTMRNTEKSQKEITTTMGTVHSRDDSEEITRNSFRVNSEQQYLP